VNFVALKMLMGDKLKYLSLVAGLSFAALLVTQQASIFAGYAFRTGSWLRDTSQFDLWVSDEQVEMTESNKPLLETSLQRVRGIPGVEWAVPMYKGQLKSRLPDGRLQTIRLVGLDDASLVGGPPEYVDGSLASLRRDGSVLINEADLPDQLALGRGQVQKSVLKVGDHLSINDHDAVVSGVYRKTPEFFWEPVIYTTYHRAMEFAPPERRQLTFVLIKVRAGESVSAVQQRVHDQLGLKAWTSAEFQSSTMDYVLKKTGILINFGMTIALGFIIGVLVSGQTLFTFVLDNLTQFAALKAMGTANLTIVRMVFLQVLTVGLVGYGIGLGGAAASGLVFKPIGLAFQMHWSIPIAGAVAILVCCAIAAMISLRKVLLLEPAIVFKG
jgi:putative ABC transport system permease protein